MKQKCEVKVRPFSWHSTVEAIVFNEGVLLNLLKEGYSPCWYVC